GAPIQGALRGYKDVNMTSIIALVSYWLIGLPTGWLLANYTELEPFGYWIGIIVGLTVAAIALFTRLSYVPRKCESHEMINGPSEEAYNRKNKYYGCFYCLKLDNPYRHRDD